MHPDTTTLEQRLARLDASIAATRQSIAEQERRLASAKIGNWHTSEELLDCLNESLDSLNYLRHVLITSYHR